MREEVLKDLVNQLKEVQFVVTGVKMMEHIVRKTGKKRWLIAYTVDPEALENIRNRMGLEPNSDYNGHITVLQKNLN